MRIPGIPGASEPNFRTRDCRWMGLDTLVMETVGELAEEGVVISPHAAKVTIQVARAVVQGPAGSDTEQLVEAVQLGARRRHVLLTLGQVQALLTTYARVIATMDILEITD